MIKLISYVDLIIVNFNVKRTVELPRATSRFTPFIQISTTTCEHLYTVIIVVHDKHSVIVINSYTRCVREFTILRAQSPPFTKKFSSAGENLDTMLISYK